MKTGGVTHSKPRLKPTKSIRFKLIAVMMGVASLTALLGYLIFISWFMSSQQKHSIEQAQSIGQLLGQDFVKILMLNDMNAASDVSTKLRSFPQIQTIVLYNTASKAVHMYDRNHQVNPIDFPDNPAHYPKVDGNLLEVLIEASYLESAFGHVLIRMHVLSLGDVLRRDLPALMLVICFMLVFSFGMAFFLERRFTDPIYKLIKFLDEIVTSDQLTKRVETAENNEFNRLYAEVNTMLERLDASQRQLKISSVAFNTPSGMVISDRNNRIVQVNEAFTKITGYNPDEVLNKPPSILNSGHQDKGFYRKMWQDLKENNYWSGEIWNRHKDGHIYPEFLTIQPIFDENDQIEYFVGSFIDLTTQKDAEEKLHQLTYYDSLTRLANRNLLTNTLDSLLNHPNKAFVLICFDIVNFKLVNDSLGQGVGDKLLVELALRLKSKLKACELISRLGSDEFAIIFPLINTDTTSRTLEIEQYIEQILESISTPFNIHHHTVRCNGKAGVSNVFEKGMLTTADIIHQANAALHRAKISPDQSFVFFNHEAQKITRHYFEVQTDLLTGLDTHQFSLYYQPQTTTEGNLRGAEALIRWNHPTKGMISPAEFIPVAEQSGFIVSLGDWVLDQGCYQLSKWKNQPGFEHLSLAINVSSKQFYRADFPNKVKQAIEKHQISPRLLKLELTESLLAHDLDQVIANMKQLSKLGVKISLDDFGTGYSSLSYLQHLPLDQIKIDQSFVRNILASETKSKAIIKTIISLCQAYDFDVIAEGVETQEELNVLTQLGCQNFQGYYFSKPLNQSDFADYASVSIRR